MTADTTDAPAKELFWRPDPDVQATRALPGWREFHRECGRHWLYFGDIERVDRRGRAYRASAFTLTQSSGDHAYGHDNRKFTPLCDGRGATPLAAVADAYQKSGFANEAMTAALEAVGTAVAARPAPAPAAPVDVDDRLGGEALDMEDLLG